MLFSVSKCRNIEKISTEFSMKTIILLFEPYELFCGSNRNLALQIQQKCFQSNLLFIESIGKR